MQRRNACRHVLRIDCQRGIQARAKCQDVLLVRRKTLLTREKKSPHTSPRRGAE